MINWLHGVEHQLGKLVPFCDFSAEQQSVSYHPRAYCGYAPDCAFHVISIYTIQTFSNKLCQKILTGCVTTLTTLLEIYISLFSVLFSNIITTNKQNQIVFATQFCNSFRVGTMDVWDTAQTNMAAGNSIASHLYYKKNALKQYQNIID